MTCIGQLYTWVNYWGEHSEHHTSEIDTCLSVYIVGLAFVTLGTHTLCANLKLAHLLLG